MDDRLAAVAAFLVGGSLAIVGIAEYVATLGTPEPFATGLFVTGTGSALLVGGWLSFRAGEAPRALGAATALGLLTLLAAVVSPDSLLFGGVVWVALVVFALVVAGVYRSLSVAR